MNRIYTLTRTDISAGQQAVQAGHSLAQYIIDWNPHITKDWANGSIINLGLGSEKSLKRWIKKIEKYRLKYSIFREPDMNNEITSIAVLSDGKIFKGIPLLLNKKVKKSQRSLAFGVSSVFLP